MADHSTLAGGRLPVPSLSDEESRRFWSGQWLVAGRTDEVADPGHYFTWELAGVPLIVVRGIDGRLRAFYNSCRHRGAPVVREAKGRNRALRCQYHSWTYDTFGHLVSAPDERDFVDLRFEERSLVPVAVHELGDWVVVNQDTSASLPVPTVAVHDGMVAIGQRTWLFTTGWAATVEKLASILQRYDPHGEVTPLSFNGALLMGEGHAAALFAWPAEAGGCRVQAIFLAPAWDRDEEEDPASTSEWTARFERLGSAVLAADPSP